jgi:hypothetical protein
MGVKLQQLEAPEPSEAASPGGGFNSSALLAFHWGLHLYSSDISAMARLVGCPVSAPAAVHPDAESDSAEHPAGNRS